MGTVNAESAISTKIAFTLKLPAGWTRYAVKEETEEYFAERLAEVFKPRGQALELMRYRAMSHKLFRELRKKRARAIYIPTKEVFGTVLPASIVTLPAPIRSADQLDEFKSTIQRRSTVEESVVDGLHVWRWEEKSVPSEGEPGALTVNHLYEAPKKATQPPVIVASTLLIPAGDEGHQLVEDVRALFDTIAATYSWVEVS